MSSTFVAEALETEDLQRYVYDVLQPAYARRYRTMTAAIEKHLVPLGVQLPQSDGDIIGGYFLWLTLPEPVKAAAVSQRAREEENLIVAQGECKTSPRLSCPTS